MRTHRSKFVAAAVATVLFSTVCVGAHAQEPAAPVSNAAVAGQIAPLNASNAAFFDHPFIKRLLRFFRAANTQAEQPAPAPVQAPEAPAQQPEVVTQAAPAKKESAVWVPMNGDAPEPANWDAIEGAHRPANPEGPTYAQWHGHRFSDSWKQRTFNWSGYEWSVHKPEGRPQAVNPATGKRTWVDGVHVKPNGDLVLSSQGIQGGVEIMSVPSLGYGTYEFTYSADFNNMHPSNVLGLFTYDWREFNRGGGFTEIDFIEISRWHAPNLDLPHASVTYYPDDLAEAKPGTGVIPAKFSIPSGYQRLTTRAEWSRDRLRVVTTTADGKVLSDCESTSRIPRDNAQQVHINLWTDAQLDRFGYQGFRSAHGDTITFHDFSYTPVGR